MTSNPLTTRPDMTVEDVWRRFGAEIRTFVRRRVSDPHRADDLVADILLRVHRNLAALDDQDRLAAWLFRIARNAIIDEYRRAADSREVLAATPGERLVEDINGLTAADHVQRELANCLRPLLSELSPEYRRALQLTDLDGITQAAAAETEGITVSGMKSRVQRARKQVAGLLTRFCALTLDSRGLPMDYQAPANCHQVGSADGADAPCGCQ